MLQTSETLGLGLKASAKLVVVIESPSYKDVEEGFLLSDRLGVLFDKILFSSGVVKEECYVTSLFKRPVKNTLKKNVKGQVKVGDEFQNAVRNLKLELDDCVNAKVVVSIGDAATYALTNRYGVDKWRGSLIRSMLCSDKYVIPTVELTSIFPPKCVWLNKHLITFDFKRAYEKACASEIIIPERLTHIKPEYDKTVQWLMRLKQTNKPIAYDIEVFNRGVSCISFAVDAFEGISIPFVHGDGLFYTEQQEWFLWKLIAEIMEDEKLVKVGHNITFDSHFLLRKYGIVARNLHDTMVAQQVLMPDFLKGLDFVTSIWTEHPYYKGEGKKWFKAGGAWETLWVYNTTDSLIVAEAFPKMLVSLKETDNERTYDRQRKLIPPLVYMMERGIKADIEGIKTERLKLEKEADELTDELCRTVGFNLNPKSPKQLADYFYNTLGFKPYVKRGAKGGVTTDDDAMKRLAVTHGCKEAQLIREIRKREKICSTYLDLAKFDDDARIRCSFNPVGTRFGRVSSSENIFDTGMNMQNWPHEQFKLLMADDGYVGYEFDLSQADNRSVAYIGQIDEMIEAFESDKDVHSLTGALISGLTYDKVKSEAKDKVPCRLGNGDKPWRDWGKKLNHSLNYDLGPNSLAFRLEVDQRTGAWLHQAYHNAYPGVRNGFHAYVQKCLRETRTLRNPLGRSVKFMGMWGDSLLKEAYSCLPQSTTGDIINEFGLLFIYYDPRMRHVELLNQIHDAVLFQIPLSLPWEEHARLLTLIKQNLETTLEWHEREFVIPADCCMYKRFKVVEKVEKFSSQQTLAEELQRNWEKLNAKEFEKTQRLA